MNDDPAATRDALRWYGQACDYLDAARKRMADAEGALARAQGEHDLAASNLARAEDDARKSRNAIKESLS